MARRVAVLAAAVAAVAATVVGVVVVALILRDHAPEARRDLLLVAILGGAATVVSVAIGTVLIVNRVLSTSLHDLTDALRAAERGKWLAMTKSTRDDEIGELSGAFDRLCATVTDLSVAVIDSDRELAWTRRELRLKEALTLLFELTQTLSADLDLQSILDQIPRKVAPALGCDEVAIVRWDEDRRLFVVSAAYGFGDDRARGFSFPRDEVIASFADSGDPLVIPDTRSDPRYAGFRRRRLNDGAFACVPMRLRGHLVGLFAVLRREPHSISDADVRLLASLASSTALAIAHAEMNQRLRAMTVTDDLTGVANRRHLMEQASRELERARRGQKPLSALMIDLDHFKRVNDERGHLRGDDVLRAVAHALQDNVRRLDTVARYGGEEFVVLLPEASKAQALVVAEKLRAAVNGVRVGDDRTTVSIGVATLPDDADSAQGLLDAADRALLEAKRAGRDRVVAFGHDRAAQAS